MRGWPYVTFILITINLAVFLFTYDWRTDTTSEYVIETFGLSPQIFPMNMYTLLTHMFIHADFLHFSGNILMLAILGLVTEPKIGSVKFLLFYFFSGFCAIPFAFLAQFFTHTPVVLIGASGAIFGLMFLGAAIAGWEEVPAFLIPLLNIVAIPIMLLTLKNIKLPLFVAILFYFLLNLITMILNLPLSIGEVAHFGGIFGGMLAFWAILPEKLK